MNRIELNRGGSPVWLDRSTTEHEVSAVCGDKHGKTIPCRMCHKIDTKNTVEANHENISPGEKCPVTETDVADNNNLDASLNEKLDCINDSKSAEKIETHHFQVRIISLLYYLIIICLLKCIRTNNVIKTKMMKIHVTVLSSQNVLFTSKSPVQLFQQSANEYVSFISVIFSGD